MAVKNARVAEGLSPMSALMGILPASVQALVGALASLPLPPVNMVATNVPGPQVPLYMSRRFEPPRRESITRLQRLPTSLCDVF
jgi:hypothetical protein